MPADSLDPRIVHRLDVRLIAALVPYRDRVDLVDVRRAFASFVATPAGRGHATWQGAWNAWTGAARRRPGQVQVKRTSCSECRGRRIAPSNPARNLARTGSPVVCGQCRGSGAGQSVRLTARHAPHREGRLGRHGIGTPATVEDDAEEASPSCRPRGC